MPQYNIVVSTEYRYMVEANNEHDAISIYLNDNDSCIPLNHGNLSIKVDHIKPDENIFKGDG
jgi:hypothetical protein